MKYYQETRKIDFLYDVHLKKMKELSRTRNLTSIKWLKFLVYTILVTGAHCETNRIIFFNESLSRAVYYHEKI
jgi:hypothetical protein